MLFFTIRNVLTGLQLVELQKHKPPIVCIDMFAIKQPIRGSPSLGFMHDCMAACLALVWKQLSILAGFRRGQWVSCSILPINRADIKGSAMQNKDGWILNFCWTQVAWSSLPFIWIWMWANLNITVGVDFRRMNEVLFVRM